MASPILPSFMKARYHILSRQNLALLNLTHSERQNFQQRKGLLGLLVTFDVLYNHFSFAILGDDERLLLFGKVSYDFSGMGLQVADGPDLS
jgi:hypothetical protein